MTYYSRAPSLKQMERGEENNIVMQHTRSESYNVSKVTYWRHVEDQTYHNNLYKTRVPTHRWQYQQDRNCTYVEANTVVRSYNHCCCGKAISITQRECVCVCVFVALGIRNEMRRLHIVMSPAPLDNIFPHFLINGTIFGKRY